ncbi:MAG: PEGA domain-containing protein, partial [Calditrichaceae bacterium]
SKSEDTGWNLYHSEHQQDFQKEAIIRSIVEEVCSQYPEMVECENHLGEIRWLTPLELNEEFEFYPLEHSLFEKIINIFSRSSSINIPDTEEWKAYIEQLRSDMKEDVEKRIKRFKEQQAIAQKHRHTEIESKIYEEEVDKFYKAKKGYKKYKNHLGEFRWMTKEEAENQDEFYEEEPSLWQTWLIHLSFIVGIIIIFYGTWIYFASDKSEPKGYLLIEGGSDKGSLYIDKNLAAGFKYNIPYPITTGEHSISLIRNGYVTIPNQQQVFIEKNDTTNLHFDFQEHTSATMGFIKVRSGSVDSRIYIDGDFSGNISGRDIIAVKPGKHIIRLDADSYIANPLEQQFEISVNDTIELVFSMHPQKSRSDKKYQYADAKLGLIEVRSNVKNADIYVNGEKTEFKTDYVLQKVEYGQYAISVRKQGYQTYPEEKVVKVNRENTRSIVNFTLSSTTTTVTLRTQPVEGEIFINGKQVGMGEFRGSLPIGEHEISFGDVPFYDKPVAQTITITHERENEFTFEYKTSLNVIFSNKEIIPSGLDEHIIRGHIFSNDNLIADSDNGPDLKLNKIINEQIWFLGYTFQYRNPPGSDALQFEFKIPANLDLTQPLNLKIWVYRSGNNYPIVVRGNAYYQIIVNGNTFRDKLLPKYSIKEISENHFDSFPINEYLRIGKNTIFISTIESTSEEVALWKIAIH